MGLETITVAKRPSDVLRRNFNEQRQRIASKDILWTFTSVCRGIQGSQPIDGITGIFENRKQQRHMDRHKE